MMASLRQRAVEPGGWSSSRSGVEVLASSEASSRRWSSPSKAGDFDHPIERPGELFVGAGGVENHHHDETQCQVDVGGTGTRSACVFSSQLQRRASSWRSRIRPSQAWASALAPSALIAGEVLRSQVVRSASTTVAVPRSISLEECRPGRGVPGERLDGVVTADAEEVELRWINQHVQVTESSPSRQLRLAEREIMTHEQREDRSARHSFPGEGALVHRQLTEQVGGFGVSAADRERRQQVDPSVAAQFPVDRPQPAHQCRLPGCRRPIGLRGLGSRQGLLTSAGEQQMFDGRLGVADPKVPVGGRVDARSGSRRDVLHPAW